MKKDDLRFITNNDNIFSIQVYIPLGSIHEKRSNRYITFFRTHEI